MEPKRLISQETLKAADIIVSLLTEDEKGLLDIVLNGVKITVIEQLCARWWDQVPIAENPFIFRAQAAQILATNKGWIALIAKLKKEDFLLRLLDPESYVEKQTKRTTGKTTDKRQIETNTDSVNLVKTLQRSIFGTGGTNRDADYASMWDKSDRERLDKMKITKPDKSFIDEETGQEDDTRGTDEEELPKPSKVDSWIDKIERMDFVSPKNKNAERPTAIFSDDHQEIEEKTIGIYDLGLNHNVNSTVSDQVIAGDTLVAGQKRQGFITQRESVVLAEAINNIHNVEFVDTREKFYRLFDPLFRRVESLCR